MIILARDQISRSGCESCSFEDYEIAWTSILAPHSCFRAWLATGTWYEDSVGLQSLLSAASPRNWEEHSWIHLSNHQYLQIDGFQRAFSCHLGSLFRFEQTNPNILAAPSLLNLGLLVGLSLGAVVFLAASTPRTTHRYRIRHKYSAHLSSRYLPEAPMCPHHLSCSWYNSDISDYLPCLAGVYFLLHLGIEPLGHSCLHSPARFQTGTAFQSLAPMWLKIYQMPLLRLDLLDPGNPVFEFGPQCS